MVDKIGNQARVFSTDKMIFSGMTVRDAGKSNKEISAFIKADKDEDGIISDKELNIYNGPSIEYTEYKQTGYIRQHVFRKDQLGTTGYSDIEDSPIFEAQKCVLYKGETIEDVEPFALKKFVDLDEDKNGELSASEIFKVKLREEAPFCQKFKFSGELTEEKYNQIANKCNQLKDELAALNKENKNRILFYKSADPIFEKYKDIIPYIGETLIDKGWIKDIEKFK